MGSPDLQAVATVSWAEGWVWLLWGKEKGKKGDSKGIPIARKGDMEGFTVEGQEVPGCDQYPLAAPG